MKKSIIFKMSICSIIAALSLVLDIYVGVVATKNIEFTFYPIPLLFMGIIFGPKYGALTGLIHAVVEQITSPYGISISSIFWGLAPIIWGSISGLLFNLFNNKGIFRNKKYKILLYFIVAFVTAMLANIANTVAIAVGDFESTKDFSIVFAAFMTRVITGERYIPVLTMLPINTVLSYVICERLRKYINVEEPKVQSTAPLTIEENDVITDSGKNDVITDSKVEKN